uniref:Uncharacterized protein n=1 Tax=Panagrolaimus sp. ES5 TaxID=591445 RepID=A0AC34F3U0_9BILA
MLMKTLETLYNSINGDLENCEARILALIMSVATIIKIVYGMRPNFSPWEKLLEKCPTFLTSLKSSVFKMKPPMISKRVVQIKGHSFVLNPVNLIVHCYQCREAVWGVNAQAYFCQNCDVIVHKQCATHLSDHCYPATQQKNKSLTTKNVKKPFTSSSSNLFGGSVSTTSTAQNRHESPSTSSTIDNLRTVEASQSMLSSGNLGHLDRSTPDLRSIHPPPIPSSSVPPVPQQLPWTNNPSPNPPSSSVVVENAKSTSSDSGIGTETEIIRQSSRGKSAPTAWNAAEQLGPPPDEAYEEPINFRRNENDFDDRSLAVLKRIELASVSGSSSLSQTSVTEEERRRMIEKLDETVLAEGDSDLEIETEVPPLESIVSWEIIRHLKPKEKKRQEVVNELFHTERTHVRNLKIISRIFYKPLLLNAQIGSGELIKLIFANLDEILEIHVEMRKKMKAALDRWRRDPSLNGLYGDIGELMEEIFSGPNGEKIIKATSVFCQHQQHALDRLRQCYGRPKDDAFASFLNEAESNSLCRKLQLKDMIPMEMQRLVKYPMLLETIAKYTKDPSPEQTQLLNSVTSAKKILQAVNGAKRNAENFRRLDELQRRLDTSSFDRNDQFEAFFQNFDFTKHKLIYEGPLTWRISRTKMVDLHVVLLETLMVFLTKGDGSKLQLKVHEAGLTPLLKLQQMIIKDKANDKRAFSILNRKDFRIFEFVAATATERKTWHRLIEIQVQETGPQNEDITPEIPFDSHSSGSTPRPHSAFEDKKIERVHVVTHPRLVNANEITIQQPTVFEHAQPILTPNERLRRDDKLIVDALVDKQKILASFLGNEKDVNELEKMADSLSTLSVGDLKQKTSKELAMSAIVQGNRLLDIINKGMSAKKENGEKVSLPESDSSLPSVPCYQLTTISAHLMNHLMALLQVIQDQQSEMSGIKQQLYHYKDLAENGPGDRTVSEETLTEPPSQPPPLPPKG